jgi:RNA-directed DNA polymerase
MSLAFAYDLDDLATELGCTAKQLGYYLYKRHLSGQYRQFEIAKKRGGKRLIKAPSTNLKLIQKSIARRLIDYKTFKPCVNGFLPDRNIVRNARPHIGQRFVLNVDLENFFGSISFARVYGMLTKAPFNFRKPVAAAIAKACTLDDALPQGAPSSPIISNLICSRLDSELSRLAAAHRCLYTRYADDLTFSSASGNFTLATLLRQPDGSAFCELSPSLVDVIASNGFTINHRKVRFSDRGRRQEVTGLVVNKRLNVRRRYIREVRAMLHAWEKFGFAAAQSAHNRARTNGTANFESVVRGKIEFIGHIRGRPDAIFNALSQRFNKLATCPKIRVILSPDEIVAQAVWVIENDGSEQGTAFFLDGYGLVTCDHCLGPNLIIYHPADHSKKFSVSVVKSNSHLDLAMLTVPAPLQSIIPLQIDTKNQTNGEPLLLVGYPAHHAARPVRIEPGSLIRSFPRSGVRYIEISPKIAFGNSGGPILNSKREVIGVAVLGLNGTVDPKSAEFLGVSVAELAKL